ncbi:hypothetical protein V2W30_39940 (plasmid) [Streptomyces sp. Q6]|uniref:Uncharacterized protein n=1 Tax=Streptomyces citrinus TaxID=3118173 RepID=A0ACD5AQN3_9ACTN
MSTVSRSAVCWWLRHNTRARPFCSDRWRLPETNTAYQAIVNAFNQHPDQPFRARELHELLDLPTDETSVNVTRTRLGRFLRQGFLTQPGRGRYQKRT